MTYYYLSNMIMLMMLNWVLFIQGWLKCSFYRKIALNDNGEQSSRINFTEAKIQNYLYFLYASSNLEKINAVFKKLRHFYSQSAIFIVF